MTAPARPQLTVSELTLIERLAEGDTYERIAKDLGVQRRTLRKRAERAFHKLGAVNMPNAVILACRAGLLDGRPQRHGDHAGYAAHKYRREEPCSACHEGELAYRAARRDARKARQRPSAPASGPNAPRTSPTSPVPASASESRTERPAA